MFALHRACMSILNRMSTCLGDLLIRYTEEYKRLCIYTYIHTHEHEHAHIHIYFLSSMTKQKSSRPLIQ